MRRLVTLLVLALAATACTRGGAPEPTAAPTTTAPVLRSPDPVRPTGGQVHAGLVYATDTGVYVLPRNGTPRLLARAGDVRDLAVSAAGRHAAWVTADSTTVHVADVLDGTSRAWTSAYIYADAIEPTDDGFVAVDGSETSRVLRFDPALLLRGGEPEATTLRGVRHARLLAAARDRVLVAVGAEAGDTVYDVAADGTVRRLFQDGPPPGRDLGRLPIGPAALTADGRRLVYGTGVRGVGIGDECTLDYGAAVRDLTTGRAVPTAAVPSLGDDVFTLVHSVTTGADGRTVVGFGTEMQSCGGQPLRGAAYAVEGGRWTLIARGAHWAASGPDGSLATISADGVLTVGKRRVASGVRLAAWSPV